MFADNTSIDRRIYDAVSRRLNHIVDAERVFPKEILVSPKRIVPHSVSLGGGGGEGAIASSNDTRVVVAISVSCLLLLLAAVLFVCYRRRRCARVVDRAAY